MYGFYSNCENKVKYMINSETLKKTHLQVI